MNWRRGFLRLWIVLGLLWTAFVVFNRYEVTAAIPDPPPGFRIDGGLQDWKFWASWVIAPIAGVGAIGWLLLWVGSGFRRTP